ncbi:MAG: hypothetical protein WCY33_05715 [Clostridia bacterium]
MKKKKKEYQDDDGRVIAPMNVEGMPWFNSKTPKTGLENSKSNSIPEKTGIKESIKLMFSIYKIVLPLSILAVAVMAGIIAIITYVWLK